MSPFQHVMQLLLATRLEKIVLAGAVLAEALEKDRSHGSLDLAPRLIGSWLAKYLLTACDM